MELGMDSPSHLQRHGPPEDTWIRRWVHRLLDSLSGGPFRNGSCAVGI